MPEAQKISVLLGCKRMVAFKIGHYSAYPKRKKFEGHDVIGSQLQECRGQSSIRVPALAAKHADHRGHDGHGSTCSWERVLVNQNLAGIFYRFTPLTGAEQRITQTAEAQVFLAYAPLSPAERDRVQLRVAGPTVVSFEILKVRQYTIGCGGLHRKAVT